MNDHSFAIWLRREVMAARCALLSLYEQKDRLQFLEGPRLEKEYMDQLGPYEERVIREEIECELLRKKQQMIQAAINRREPIDEAAIDAELGKIREVMLQEASGDAAPSAYAELSEEDSDELQMLYHEIVRRFHPQMHPELSDTHRQLYQKAQEAYRCRDLDTLRLIDKMLTDTQDGTESMIGESDILVLAALLAEMMKEQKEDALAKQQPFETDYGLVSLIFGSFKPTTEEAALQEECRRCGEMATAVKTEIQELKSQFPYNAAEMLSDPQKIEQYKQLLAHRFYVATEEQKQRTEEIQMMIGSVVAHE